MPNSNEDDLAAWTNFMKAKMLFFSSFFFLRRKNKKLPCREFYDFLSHEKKWTAWVVWVLWKLRLELSDSLVAQYCLILCDPMDYSTPGLPVHQQLQEFTQIHVNHGLSVIQSNHLILCCPLLLLPSIFPSIRLFSNESVLCIRWPKDWSFSFNISPSNEYSGLISFRMDWLDLSAVQQTVKNLLHHHSSKASILLCLAFFIAQLSNPYMTTGKAVVLTR